MLLFALTTALAAEPVLGLEWRPLSRADLVWLEDGRSSGTGVSEHDGLLNHGLRPFAGAWLSPRWGLFGSLSVARLSTTTWVDDVWRTRSWTVVRPALDARFLFTEAGKTGPRAWALAGASGDLPAVRDRSNGFSESEAEAAASGAYLDQARLGGVGARLGVGAELEVTPGLSLGAQWTLDWHSGVLRSAEVSASARLLTTQGALLLSYGW